MSKESQKKAVRQTIGENYKSTLARNDFKGEDQINYDLALSDHVRRGSKYTGYVGTALGGIFYAIEGIRKQSGEWDDLKHLKYLQATKTRLERIEKISSRSNRIFYFGDIARYKAAIDSDTQDVLKHLGRRKNTRDLEQTASAATAIVGIVGGLFFLSSNLTGNVIGNLNQTSSNFIGIGLFLVGLVGAFFYFRKK